MKIRHSRGNLTAAAGELIVLPLFVGKNDTARKSASSSKQQAGKTFANLAPRSATVVQEINSLVNGAIAQKLKKLDFSFRAGRKASIPVNFPLKSKKDRGFSDARTVRIYTLANGTSTPEGLAFEDWRKIGGDAFQTARSGGFESVTVALSAIEDQNPEMLRCILEGFHLTQYAFTKFKSEKPKQNGVKLQLLEVISTLKPRETSHAEKTALMTANAVSLARDLVNTPPSALPPREIVREARRVASSSRGKIKLKVYDKKALTKLRAHALLGVSLGSDEPPFLLHLTFRGAGAASKRKQIVLIGKGVTFDSGGLSIKPAGSMMTMKCDMAGAACVLAVMSALPQLHRIAPLNCDVHVLIPTTENLLGGSAFKPGDVVRAMNGKTIEVLNTDAEGRLILADALAFSERLKADVTIDIATLTGACVVALGSDYAAIFTESDPLLTSIRKLGETAGERFWQLPLAKEYRGQLESTVADVQNIANAGGPGAIMAALFLKEFVPANTAWAHLDIAGSAFGSKGNEYTPSGGNGFGVRTLLRYLEKGEFGGK